MAEEEVNELDKALMKSEAFFEDNWKNIAIGLGAALVVVIGLIYYFMGYKGPRNTEAAEAMFPAEQAFQQDSFAVALNGKADVVGFLTIIDEYGGTDAANAAKGYAGICYKQLGDLDNAAKYLKSYSPDGGIVEPAINGALGDVAWDANNESDAVSYYKKAINAKDLAISPVYMYRLGLLYFKKGDKAAAKSQFQDLKKVYPSAPESRDAARFIAMCD